jgi:hypothetical protein
MDFCGCAATPAMPDIWWRSVVAGAASVPAAGHGAWPRVRRGWSMRCFPSSPYVNGGRGDRLSSGQTQRQSVRAGRGRIRCASTLRAQRTFAAGDCAVGARCCYLATAVRRCCHGGRGKDNGRHRARLGQGAPPYARGRRRADPGGVKRKPPISR